LSIQKNNILVITRAQSLAAAYESDFEDLWKTKTLAGTGVGDADDTKIGATDVAYSFAPGEGTSIVQSLAELIKSARSTISVASMLISSTQILQALADQVSAEITVEGIYDSTEMAEIEEDWHKNGSPNAALWAKIAPRLRAKASFPFEVNSPHNLMQNKILVVDDTVATGSVNFSNNAMRNAENMLRITSP
jgi:phosphatidylserine/phosphatidylglycerophosphate/cardiolipin synthase-like enzyme